jgi:hypothetical protein
MDLLVALVRENEMKKRENKDNAVYRGIKTSSDVAEHYLNSLFEYLLANEQEFLDNLSNPFASEPLQEMAFI